MTVKIYKPRRIYDPFENEVFTYLSTALETASEDYLLFGPVYINRRELDGLIIGNGFMVTLEAKAFKGHVSMGDNIPVTVRTEEGEVLDFQERHEDPYDQAEKQWRELSSFIENAFGETELWFASMLVFQSGSTFDVPERNRAVHTGASLLVSLDEIPEFLMQLSRQRNKLRLSSDQREALVKAIVEGAHKLSESEKDIFARPVTSVQTPRKRISSKPVPSKPVVSPLTRERVETSHPREAEYIPPPVRVRHNPWYRSGWFLLFAFIFLNPLWALLMITAPRKHCFFRLLATFYFIGQLTICAQILFIPGSISVLLNAFDISTAVPEQINLPAPEATSPANTSNPTRIPTIQSEQPAEIENDCTILWVETEADDLANKNRAMVWEEIIRDQIAGSGMTDRQFYDQVVERNPTLKADGYVFLEGKTYYLPQCE